MLGLGHGSVMLSVVLLGIDRHAARLLELEYVGDGPIDLTLFLVGKVCKSCNLCDCYGNETFCIGCDI